jgi:hypothetical protein
MMGGEETLPLLAQRTQDGKSIFSPEQLVNGVAEAEARRRQGVWEMGRGRNQAAPSCQFPFRGAY